MPILLNNHFPDLLDLDAVQLHCNGFSLDAQIALEVVPDIIEQFVVDGLIDGHASVGVELQRPLQEVIDLGSDELEQLAEWLARDHPEGFNVVFCALVADEVDVGGRADGAEDDGPK